MKGYFHTMSIARRARTGGNGFTTTGPKEVIDSLDLGILCLDRDARVIYLNPPVSELLNRPGEEIQGKVFWDLIPGGLGERFAAAFRSALEGNTPVHFEAYYPAQSVRCFDCRFLPTLQGVTLTLEDITERNRIEEELRFIEDIQRFHFSHSNDVIYSYDNNFRVLSVSPNVERILGYRPEEIVGRYFPDLGILYRNDIKRASSDALSILSGSTVHSSVYRFIAKDGSIHYGDTSGIPLMRNGRVAGVISVARDITDRKKAEAAIRESEEKYRLVVENANEGIIVVQGGVLCFVNPKISRLLGHAREDLIGKRLAPFIHPDDRDLVMGRHARRLKGESLPAVYPFRILDGKGKTRWMEINAVRITWEGKPATLNFLTDISERVQAEHDLKRIEEQLGQSQMIESLGSFAGGIAHSLNNFIYPVIINTELLLEDAKPGSREQEILEQTLNAACRQRDLVRQILFFSSRKGSKPSPVQVAPLLEETIGFLRASIPSTIEIRKSINAPWDTVMGDAAQIQQVIMNLCKNAADAMGSQQGVIEIRLENTRLKTVDGHSELKPGRFLVLSVRDDGCGMTEEVMRHIFEPFFTTKEVGKGSGMGLPAVHGIVKSHGGAVTVRSTQGEGTQFMVYLPVYGSRSAKKALPESSFVKSAS